jgi:hypothetical protein
MPTTFTTARNLPLRTAFGLMLALGLAACSSVPPLQAWQPEPPTSVATASPDTAAQLAEPGPWRVVQADVSQAVGAAVPGCEAVVERYMPEGNAPAAATPLVFAHGFLRDVANHREHARHLASWGVPVYLVGHCSGGWGRAVEGVPGGGAGVLARFMRQVADFSGAKAVVYGGFSAGGRASRSAALADPRTMGWLGLDPVDRLSAAQREAGPVPFPMYALFAPPASCNAQQLGRGLTAASAQGRALEVVGTTHCHFEAPSNLLCHAACGEPGPAARNAELRRRITTLATAFVRWRAGLVAQAPDALWREAPGVLVAPQP